MPGTRPIKAFIKARHQSVADQLAGKSEGRSLGGGGFGGPPQGGARGPANFGPGRFLGPVFLNITDTDSNGQASPEEFHALAARWFGAWDGDSDSSLTQDQLREGLAKAFPPPNFNRPPPAGGR